MKNRCDNQAGFASIVEVIISAIIFTFAALGIFTSIASMRPEAADSSVKLEAALAAKGKLEEFRRSLSPAYWTSGDLTVGNHSTSEVINGKTYTFSWVVSIVPGMDDYVRRVDFTVNY